MSKPYTEQNLSDIFDVDLNWRRKELSDLKAAVRAADDSAKPVFLRALITMGYAHWEGYVRTCADRYFEYLTLRRKPFVDFERQIYVNSHLIRLDALYQSRTSLEARCKLINDILDGASGRFSFINPELIDTKSNLNTDAIKDICAICNVESSHFEQNRTFLDVLVLKRRNAIAHGQQEFIRVEEIDYLVGTVLSLMSSFRNLLENKIYTKAYAA
jgi:RiboL-PSP-HEPN